MCLRSAISIAVMTRHTALIYNWWSLYMWCLIPERHAEAFTSRPLLLFSIGKQTHHAGQTELKLTGLHAQWKWMKDRLQQMACWLKQVQQTAKQLDGTTTWHIILSRIFSKSLQGRQLASPYSRCFLSLMPHLGSFNIRSIFACST